MCEYHLRILFTCVYPSLGIASSNFAEESHTFKCIFSAAVISGVPRWPKMYNKRSEECVATVGIYQLTPLKFKWGLC
jgi:hypothetical protein